MIYLTTPSNPRVRAEMRAGLCGAMLNPRDRKSPADLEGITYALDNGRYGARWSEVRWRNQLDRYQPARARCLFAVVPDVVADADATLEEWHRWSPIVRAAGYPLAFVAQDGYRPELVPWDELEVWFAGGTTEWKLTAAWSAALDARARGKRTHLGRCNSGRRIRAAAPFYDTADGNLLRFGPDVNLERIRRWCAELTATPPLTLGATG